MQRRPIRVALVNDYEVVVAGLLHMFANYSERIEVVKLVAGREVRERVDVALFDSFGTHSGDVPRVERVIHNPLIGRTVIYTWNFQPALIERATQEGASGYLSKTLPARQLVEAIEQVHAGKVVVSPSPKTANPAGGNWPGREEGLSYRESEVVALITQGLSNAEIAQGMYLSPNSVKSYIRSAYRKIGVMRRSQAVSWGMRHGFSADYVRLDPADVSA
ncbi:helix-turn-helix transcriptional regulator [Micropruina sonneratiae]|uniref:helix-turn-helix transcriptional regulator n=1 Tax=Micropruina sonneratiae TaxID=2986940 RepID=UPI0022269FBE|nr:response regulator transcription factor [Micropruina sp. KQZ13P-5]MCW3157613.1 response regulator transcription factor [Micropruina sp. KQZ13P-5]